MTDNNTQNNLHFHYTIAGAGLSGLALALNLSDLEARSSTTSDKAPKTVCLIEPRSSYERDHTWCFWNNVVEKLDVAATKTWQKWKVKYRSKTSIRGSKRYPYTCVLANSYYDQALDKLKSCENINIFLGESLKDVDYLDSGLVISTSQRTLTSQFLFDSRPPQALDGEFKQDFLGWQIKADRAVFDSNCVTLMDFTENTGRLNNSGIEQKSKTAKGGFHFFYTLPFSQTEALVESVWVGFERLGSEEHEKLLTDYLASEYGLKVFEKIHTEIGCIPMHSVNTSSPDARHTLIGIAGGMARSSTGYAFSAIHHSSRAISNSIKRNRWPNSVEGLSTKAQLLDKVLLTYLKQNPGDGPLLLSSLFERVDPDVLVRFLCDRSTLADDASIFAVMPKKVELAAIMAQTIL